MRQSPLTEGQFALSLVVLPVVCYEEGDAMRKRLVSAALVLVTVLPIGAVLFPATSAQAETSAWAAWTKRSKPTVVSLTTAWTAIENAANANNKGAVKADLIKLSNESVVFASIADSPSKQLNRLIVKTGVASNSVAWTGYIYLITKTTTARSRFEHWARLLIKDLHSMAAIMRSNGL